MLSLDDFYHHIILEIFTGIARFWFAYLLGIVGMTLAVRMLTDKLKTHKEVIMFWIGLFILFSALAPIIGIRSQVPNFISSISNIHHGPYNNGKDTVAVLEMSAINSGSMQSILTGWNIEASINGVKYNGTLIDMPSTFTFNFPELPGDNSITYRHEDQLPERAVTPIPPGGTAIGTLFVVFEGVKSDTFNSGADFLITFTDAFSNKFAAATKLSAQHSAKLHTLPGLHTEMICKAPPDLLKSLQPAVPSLTPIPGVPPKGG